MIVSNSIAYENTVHAKTVQGQGRVENHDLC